MATIKDIAKKAGVSTATVSRILNGQGGYTEETFKKVKAISQELNYTKNTLARNLVRKKSQIIGVVVPNVSTSFSNPIIDGIEDFAESKGFNVIIAHAGLASKHLSEKIGKMKESQVDGLIIISSLMTKKDGGYIKKLGLKTVLISTMLLGSDFPYIKVNDFSAMYQITNYLIKLGHRKIAIVGPNMADGVSGIPRFAGYKQALTDAGIRYEADWLQAGVFDFESGQIGMRNILKKRLDVTAACCVSDECALGVISEAAGRGISIPEQFSVTGYDGTELAKMVTPTLTTIKQPFYQMGYQGCEGLVKMINNNQLPYRNQLVDFSIQVGKTTKKIGRGINNV